MRIRAIDWLRGFVMVLMTVDHAGSRFDASHMHGDAAAHWTVGSPLPAGEFLTRWITHLCAPTFILLAGASLALSAEKRRDQPGQTRFIVTRGLFIAALDPLWMSLGFTDRLYDVFVCQVLYAIGLSMACMAFLRKLPTAALVASAIALQLGGELTSLWHPSLEPWNAVWTFLFVGGRLGSVIIAYPFVPWLSIMMLGWVLGRWLLEPRPQGDRARPLALLGVALLGLFAVLRGLDGYGNWNLHRDSGAFLQWLHVSKYPPSLTYCCLELGLALLAFAAFLVLDDPARPRRGFAVLSLLGSTAFFYYLLHVHLMKVAWLVLGLDANIDGLAKTWLFALATVAVLLWPCAWYRRYKSAHPNGWTRYV